MAEMTDPKVFCGEVLYNPNRCYQDFLDLPMGDDWIDLLR